MVDSNGLSQSIISNEDSWIDPRFVVVFVQDGGVLGECKSFKMNLQEIISKYDIKRPGYMKHETREHKEMKLNFQKRAYKELLEYCSDHILNQAEENDPTRRKAFKMLYTPDGAPLKTLDEIRNYCQADSIVTVKKMVR